MKKIAVAFCVLILVCVMVSCKPPSKGGNVLESDFKLIVEKQTPDQGTPDDYSPEDNLAFAAYKFNRASMWESVYTGEIIAVGTKQRVKNIRQYSNGVTFSQAISVSGIKTVAEQKYVFGDTYLRRPYVTLDKNTLDATWSKSVTQLSAEEYYRDYGLIPNEIFKYTITEDIILSAEKIESENYAFSYTLSTDCAKYLKNEVRTLAGSKSDPEFLSVECTVEMDESWNIIRTTVKEKYKIAILGGVTCNSTATEEFTVGKFNNQFDKSAFESFVPGGAITESEQPKQPIDYLTLAFGNLASEGTVKLEAQIAGQDATVNLDTQTGLFAFEVGDTIIKSTGNYLYISGKENVKIYTLSIAEAIYFASKFMPDNVPAPELNSPETEALIGEVTSMLSSSSDEEASGESIINRILESIDMQQTENGALISMYFSLDGVAFDVQIMVSDDELVFIRGDITSGENVIDIYLHPTDKIINGDFSSAADITSLIRATINTINSGYLSLESDDSIVTLDASGNAYFNSPEFNASYADGIIKLSYQDKKAYIDTSDLTDLQMGELDVVEALMLLQNLPANATYQIDDNLITVSFEIGNEQADLTVKAINGKLDLTVNVGDVTFSSTDKKATVADDGEYANLTPIVNYTSKIVNDRRIDLRLTAQASEFSQDTYVSFDLNDKSTAIKLGETLIQATDAIYIIEPDFVGKLSYEALSEAFFTTSGPILALIADLAVNDLPTLTQSDLKLLLALIDKVHIQTKGDTTVLTYRDTLGDADLEVTLTLDESFDLCGSVTYADTKYSISLAEGYKLEAVDVQNYVDLDPIAYFATDLVSDSTTFAVELNAGNQTLNSLVMTDLDNKGLVVKVSNSYIYAYDKLYFENLNTKLSLSYEAVANSIGQYGVTAEGMLGLIALLTGETTYTQSANVSISQSENIVNLAISDSDYKINILFDTYTNYLDRLTAECYGAEITVTPALADIALPDSYADFVSYDDTALDLTSSIINTYSQKQFTVTAENLTVYSGEPLELSGSIGIDIENELKLYLDLTFIQNAQSHNVKANVVGENVAAMYNDSINVTLNKDTVIELAFMAIDLIGIEIPELEALRPVNSEKVQSDLLGNLTGLAEATQSNTEIKFGIDQILRQLDTFALSKGDGSVSLNMPKDSIAVTLSYGEMLKELTFASPTVGGTVTVDYSAQPVVLPDKAFDLNSLPSLIKNLLSTAELNQFNVSGSIQLSLFSLINPTINFTLKTAIQNNKPLVYLKLEVPSVSVLAEMLQRSDSYIYYYDGVMYLKSDRYKKSGLIITTTKYDHTEYLRRTPEEFAANAMDDIFFLIPVSSTIVDLVMGSMQDSESKFDLTNALKGYEYANDVYDITVDLNAMLGNKNLGDMSVTLTASEKLGKKAITNVRIRMGMLSSLVTMTLNASLNDFDGEVTYGEGENGQSATDITEMPEVIEGLKQLHAEWQ